MFCERFAAFEQRANATFRNRHTAGAAIQTDYAGQTVPIVDPLSGEIRPAQIFVAVLPASLLTFAYASFSQRLPDWIEGQQWALSFYPRPCSAASTALPQPSRTSQNVPKNSAQIF